MEKEINIADILQDDPQGTKLYSPACGNVQLDTILGNQNYCIRVKDADFNYYKFTEFGKLSKQGECMLFPSNKMRDWEKFQWKKGDVLVNKFDKHCIFKWWSKVEYTNFASLNTYGDDKQLTSAWTKEFDENAAKQYISEIESIFGGKLNIDTLMIFKDGDIVVGDNVISIYRKIYEHTLYFYACIDKNFGLRYNSNTVSINPYRLATEEEKQQLFDALAKEGKRWNPDTKQIEKIAPVHDVSQSCFHPFQQVLVRNSDEEYWQPKHYAYKCGTYHICTDSKEYSFCIPYEGNEYRVYNNELAENSDSTRIKK